MAAKPVITAMPVQLSTAVHHASAIADLATRLLFSTGELDAAIVQRAVAVADALELRDNLVKNRKVARAKLASVSACAEVCLAEAGHPVLSLSKLCHEAGHVACGTPPQQAEVRERVGHVWPKRATASTTAVIKQLGFHARGVQVLYSAAGFAAAAQGIEPARVTARAAKPSYFNSAVAVEMRRIEHVSVARMLAPLCLCVFTSACV